MVFLYLLLPKSLGVLICDSLQVKSFIQLVYLLDTDVNTRSSDLYGAAARYRAEIVV
ncbi:hypothetical protein [Roseobacter fucihabitans]|uniref:hypothetical protein n=1 Tax=Roseobacter fucihabitans TaxID=1537242 RepID=UPI001652F97B|nr:hypothetical protein [Roseobacter litoralis]